MLNSQQLAEIKTHLPQYLANTHSITELKKPFRCLSSTHEDKNPSMFYNYKTDRIKCFSCNVSYDIIDLIKQDYKLNNSDAFKRAETFSKNIIEDGNPSANIAKNQPKNTYKPAQSNDIEENAARQKRKLFIKMAQGNIKKTKYGTQRGISEKIIDSHGLGYNFKNNAASDLKSGFNALIIPIGDDDSYIMRNINVKNDEKTNYPKFSIQGKTGLFNAQAFDKETQDIFITEGAIDAMSIEEVADIDAVALTSTANVNFFIEYIKNKNIKQRLIIALDSDRAGKESAKKLSDQLDALDVKNVIVGTSFFRGQKDPNSALLNDKNAFKKEVARVLNSGKGALSNAAYLGTFLYDMKQKKHIPTGFEKLDRALNGGLTAGIYLIGAMPGLGKTTFCLQVADKLAESENVLIFSLEMQRSDLIGKSLSRKTYEKNNSTAKSHNELMRLDEDDEQLKSAIDSYRVQASNIFVYEQSSNRISIEYIRSSINKHIEKTGKTPIVFVDYIQLLNGETGETDKQVMDKICTSLRSICNYFNVPVVCISSFNRQSYSNEERPTPPTLSAFKESGSLEYSADVALSFWCKVGKLDSPRNIELIVLKNKRGEVPDPIPYEFNAKYNHFEEAFTGPDSND